MPTECVCPPGESGRCAHCRSRLALRFAEASYQAAKLADGSKNGMRMRDARPHTPSRLIRALHAPKGNASARRLSGRGVRSRMRG